MFSDQNFDDQMLKDIGYRAPVIGCNFRRNILCVGLVNGASS